MNQNRDWDYYHIIQSKDRGEMYKYKLIMAIVKDLDEYLEETNLDIIDNETILLRKIDHLYNKHSPNLIKYFTLFGGKFSSKMSINDIEEWTNKYKKKNRLFYKNNSWIYGQYN